MINVLLSSPRITAGYLDVSVRIGGDPDLRPGGRNDQFLDSATRLRTNPTSKTVDIGEPTAFALAVNARLIVGDVVDLHGARRTRSRCKHKCSEKLWRKRCSEDEEKKILDSPRNFCVPSAFFRDGWEIR